MTILSASPRKGAAESRLPFYQDVLATITLAVPIAIALLMEMAMGVSEYLMSGMLGTDALASGGFGAQFLFVPKILAIGVLYSVAALGSHARGADKPDELLRILRQGLRLAVILSAPVMLAMLGLGPILRLLSKHHNLDIDAIEQLMWWALPSVLPGLWYQVLRNFVTILGKPVAITIIGLAVLPVFAGVLYLLMFGAGSWHGMGVPAIGLATSISCWLQFGLGVVYVKYVPIFRTYPIFQQLRQGDAKLLKEMLLVGAPIAGAYLFETGMFFASTSAMSGFGSHTLAAHNIVLNISSITFMIPYALGQAGTVRVGYALGAGKPYAARQAGFTAIGLGLIWMLIAAAGMWLAPRLLTSFYLDLDDPANAMAIAVAMTLFPIAAIFQFFDGLQVSSLGILRGYKDTKVPMLMTFIGYWVLGIGGGIVLAYGLDVRGPGVWWGLAVGLAASGTMLLLRFLYLARRYLALDQ